MCRVLEVAPLGYYDWLLQPLSNRAQEDARLLRLIRASFIASHGIFGSGTQYGSDARRRFCRSNRVEPSMSRRGNCWDDAVAESFFSSSKTERIKNRFTRTVSWRQPT
jgi:putative transposase